MTAAQTMQVELVGGPRDGQQVAWPLGTATLTVTAEEWQVRYAYCGQGVDGKLRAQIIREDVET